jgi:hypothetical protein
LQLRVGGVLFTVAMVKEVAEPEILPASSVVPDPHAPIPKQIRYIIGNEGCGRFSFYGMRNILTVFLVSSLLLYLPEENAPAARRTFFIHSSSAFTFSRCWVVLSPVLILPSIITANSRISSLCLSTFNPI